MDRARGWVGGFAGAILGGVASDRLKAGYFLPLRETPIVAGMLLAMMMIACNYVNSSLAVILLMSLAFFSQGFGALGCTVISDTSPKSLVGVNGALFNLIGKLAGINTPIIIGAIIEHTGTFHYALLYAAATALLAIVAYLPIVSEIRCLESPRDLIAGSNA